MASIDELAQHMIDESVVTALGTDLFLNQLEDAPDAGLLIRETGGAPGDRGFGVVGLQYEWPGFQIIARGAADDQATPRALAKSAQAACAKISATTLGSTLWHFANVLQEPFALEQDSLRRWKFAFNVLAQKEPS